MRPNTPRRLLVLVGLLMLAACGSPSADPGSSEPQTGGGDASLASAPAAERGCEYVPAGPPARPVTPPSATDVLDRGTATFVLATSEGEVTITMDRAKAPCTVHSFESLAQQGYFDNTACHRLVDSGIFVLQCGDPTGTGSGGPGYTFPDETSGAESYREGVVAMANAGPDTNGSQFFLVYADSTGLDAMPNYTIFGHMDEESRSVVARISAEGQDGSNPAGGGKPNNPARITSVTKR